MRRAFLLGLALAAAGCGGRGVVPVSGVVTLNGKPYPNAIVSFQPLGGTGDLNPGRGSSAVTDRDGRFTLLYDGERPGALAGRHRVRICTKLDAGPSADDGDPAPRKGPARRLVEVIPPEWHDQSTKEFEVPRRGTDKADFDIVAPGVRN